MVFQGLWLCKKQRQGNADNSIELFFLQGHLEGLD